SSSRTGSRSGCARSEGAPRLIAARPRTDRDHREPVWPGNRLPRGLRVEAENGAGCERDFVVLDPVDARATSDDVHLFLPGFALVVLAALRVRGQLEPVDAEGPDAELAAHEAHRAAGAGRLDLVDPHHRVTHRL